MKELFSFKTRNTDAFCYFLFNVFLPRFPITNFSLFFLHYSGLSGNWIEIAYGTKSGAVKVIVQHPETVGHAPQLFQTFTVHQSPVIKVTLSEKYLISVCSEYNHVRTWRVTRFRGMIRLILDIS